MKLDVLSFVNYLEKFRSHKISHVDKIDYLTIFSDEFEKEHYSSGKVLNKVEKKIVKNRKKLYKKPKLKTRKESKKTEAKGSESA